MYIRLIFNSFENISLIVMHYKSITVIKLINIYQKLVINLVQLQLICSCQCPLSLDFAEQTKVLVIIMWSLLFKFPGMSRPFLLIPSCHQRSPFWSASSWMLHNVKCAVSLKQIRTVNTKDIFQLQVKQSWKQQHFNQFC